MNRTLVAVLLVVILAIGAYVIAGRRGPNQVPTGSTEQIPGPPAVSSESPSAPVVFALKYRGLEAPDDPLSYRSYRGYGRPEDPNNPFVQAVRSRVREYKLVCHAELPKARWSVVELKDKQPVALYFDANGDGQLADNEKFLPIKPAGPSSEYLCAFVTSDFMLRNQEGQEIPFRLMLLNMAQGPYMWGPACVLEGQATLAGKTMKLFLYANGFTGSFTTFGLSTFALLPAEQKLEGHLSYSPLSSLIQYEGTFYRVGLSGTHEKDKTVSITLEKDTTPTGRVTVAFQSKDTLQARLTPATITGATDNSIRFAVEGSDFSFPAGRYRLSRSDFSYGVQGDNEWQASLNEGPIFDVSAGKTGRVDLGALTLTVGAIDDNQQYQSSAQERSTFASGTPIYLTPHIKGKAGEVYDRFAQKATGSDHAAYMKPHVTITDAGGKQILSADMAYG